MPTNKQNKKPNKKSNNKKKLEAASTTTRIAISLSLDEVKTVSVIAKRFGMRNAAVAAFCVRYFLSRHSKDMTLPQLGGDQQELDI